MRAFFLALICGLGLSNPVLAEEFPALLPFDGGNGDLDVTLVAKETEVRIGNQNVTSNVYIACYSAKAQRDSAGMIIGCDKPDDPRQAYAGPLLKIEPGHHLKITLINAMTRNHMPPTDEAGDVGLKTNLHTHGLIVRPRGPEAVDQVPEDRTPGRYEPNSIGDFIFVAQQSNQVPDSPSNPGTDSHSMAGMAMSGPMRFDILIPSDHPRGIFWFHPHYHGLAKEQVSGGMAGMIAVGTPSYLCIPKPGADTCADDDKVDFSKVGEREILLKDAQLNSRFPGSSGDPATATIVYDQDTRFCESKGTFADEGFCGDDSSRWVLTVNGAETPEWQANPASNIEVWRIQNASANITYNLCLSQTDASGTQSFKVADSVLPDSAEEPCAEGLPFRVLSLDGVALAGDATNPAWLQRRVLLMPGSRIEIAVQLRDKAQCLNQMSMRDTDCPLSANGQGQVQLRNMAYSTGGDVWPQVLLARVNFGASRQTILTKGPRASLFRTGLATPMATGSMQNPLCRSGYVRILAPREKRRVYFAIVTDLQQLDAAKQERFLLGTSIIQTKTKDDNDVEVVEMSDDGKTIYSHHYPMHPIDDIFKSQIPLRLFTHDMADMTSDLCVAEGQQEDWELVNISSEVHNFHIHQNKFKLGGAFKAPNPIDRLNLADTVLYSPDTAKPGGYIYDTIIVPRGAAGDCAKGQIDGNGDTTGFISSDKADPTLYHYDSGAGCSLRTPAERGAGMMPIHLDFGRLDPANDVPGEREKVGRYVFHCHILEHEDLGMMASIRVLSHEQLGQQ